MATRKRKKTAERDEGIQSVLMYSERHEPVNEARNLDAGKISAIVTAAESSGDMTRLFALYRDMLIDGHVFSEFSKRKAPVAGDEWTVSISDEWLDESNEKLIAGDLERYFKTKDFYDAVAHLLNATLYPVAVLEKVFEPASYGFRVQRLIPVPYALVDFRKGNLQIRTVDGEGKPTDETYEPDETNYMIFRAHNMPIPDRWGGPMRGVLAWWWFRVWSRQWWHENSERWNSNFFKGKYSDPAGKQELIESMSFMKRLGGVVIHKNTELEIINGLSSGSVEGFKMAINVCNDEISRLIIGQTLSSTASPTGIGSGASDLQGDIKNEIHCSDEAMILMTLTECLRDQLLEINTAEAEAFEIKAGLLTERETRRLIAHTAAIKSAGLF